MIFRGLIVRVVFRLRFNARMKQVSVQRSVRVLFYVPMIIYKLAQTQSCQSGGWLLAECAQSGVRLSCLDAFGKCRGRARWWGECILNCLHPCCRLRREMIWQNPIIETGTGERAFVRFWLSSAVSGFWCRGGNYSLLQTTECVHRNVHKFPFVVQQIEDNEGSRSGVSRMMINRMTECEKQPFLMHLALLSESKQQKWGSSKIQANNSDCT